MLKFPGLVVRTLSVKVLIDIYPFELLAVFVSPRPRNMQMHKVANATYINV